MEEESDLSAFLKLLSNPDALTSDLLWSKQRPCDAHPVLLETVKQLFAQVEKLGKLHKSLLDSNNQGSLSGLDELYMGEGDLETLWGQVGLQNDALYGLLKHSIRSLSKATKKKGKKEIRLLEDMAGDVGEPEREDDENESQATDKDEEMEGDDDEERLRIQKRMEQAMADMEEEDDENVDKGSSHSGQTEDEEKEQDVVDPAREDLNDGFFDLHEMEAFADEEEEYLPDAAFGQENPDEENDEKDRRTFHQRQRDGDVDKNSEDESEEDVLTRKTSLVRRKRYRKDDEVEALYSLYNEAANVEANGDDEDSENDVINMTAADIFGKPRKNNYQERMAKSSKSSEDAHAGVNDDDSWNEYEFDENDNQQKETGWNDGDRQNTDDESEDEVIPMKDGGNLDEMPNAVPKRNNKLDVQTEQLEKEMLAEKPWQMTGETTGASRPTNSLLEATPEFEVATKMAPIITVEHTKTLEEVIKERILEEKWDDVVPRELPDVGWHARRGELPEVSQEKSKLGLGELYEREYLKKAVGYDVDAAEKESEEEKAKNEMKSLFANLCSKLDALSNYHFAPRPIEPEADVRPITKPAIAMEEVLPLHVSEARGVAPEEVYGSKRGRDGVLRTDSELDQNDRKRLRSTKKAARRKKRKQKLADEKLVSRLQPGLGLNNPYEKRKMQEQLSMARASGKITMGQADSNDYGGSGTFFERLQAKAQQSIDGAHGTNSADKRAKKKTSGSGSAFKL